MNSKAFFGGVVVSPEADMVARELIHELHIPNCNLNLAFCWKSINASMITKH